MCVYIYIYIHEYTHTHISHTYIKAEQMKPSANEKTTYRMWENIANDAVDNDLILKIHKQLI